MRKLFLIFILIFCVGCSPQIDEEVSADLADTVEIHYIDVGQGDSILISDNEHYMLIDAGENNKGELVSSYLKSEGIDYIDYVIGTHPHSDHIGGLDYIIDEFAIGNILMPKKSHTTATYEDVLIAIKNKGLKITAPVVGTTYQLGNSSFTIIAPNNSYGEDLNNYSVGIKLQYGNTSFIMCGDAEKESEADIIKNGIDLDCDVLKLGHHGSNTSSSDKFLDITTPDYAIISCGKDNSYNHPHKEVIERLNSKGIKYFRTDEVGSIIATTDGSSISFTTVKSPEK